MITQDANRQYACLCIIRDFEKRNDCPTRAEIGRRMGISKVSAHLLVRKLQDQGLVYIVAGTWRNIYLTGAGGSVPSSHFKRKAQKERA